MDPVRLEIFRHRFSAIAEEMGVALCRSAFSPNIKERRDYSCALFDSQGRMVEQASHLPVHLGSMPMSVQSALESMPAWEPGDMVLLNDPYRGGTHLPDLTLVAPVFSAAADRLVGFVANRAHHADVGGMAPGSLSTAREIFQEGLRLPPLRICRAGEVDEHLLRLILANVRTPEERRGDLMAQVAANYTGQRRLSELLRKEGVELTCEAMVSLLEYSGRMTRAMIREIPDGVYSFTDYLDDDGISEEPVRIAVQITIAGEKAAVDFTGSDPQCQGPVNAVLAVTVAAVFYVFRSLSDPRLPSNSGVLSPIEIRAPRGSVVNAVYPAAVGAGNTETSQRIVDVLLGALAQAIAERIPAASCGSMSSLVVGGVDPQTGEPFTYYETIAGGMGARPDRDGLDGVHTHMTNTMNTPVEALELSFPLRVLRYGLRRGSGGAGSRRGGDGIIREIECLTPATVSILSERRKFAPYGLQGGYPGKPGENLLTREGRVEPLPGKVTFCTARGDRISISTPGGGGYGTPAKRGYPRSGCGSGGAP
ncbi:MAG: hydantoinase B/oxoprolinase family protein [Candidatus Tectomicrobia bacterium]|uniref:Hydantoinase B/oxoprolinase family protein n=1 Tax=Tectimicrobiota bacterium TaxID=2528274 RepID=A0A932GR39_UNCTE|nr:hydantoinase B/oxoprolinase family protein [Candidatus Tectomicrobia bacterium]